MINPTPKALAIYARKSTESEDRQVLSIDSQVKELKAFAEREGIRVSQVFIESKSAKSPGRPIFNELFSLVQKGKIDAVMCWKLDRIARNPVDGGAVIWAMEERRLQAIYTPQRVFINTGNDKFWMQLEFGMAKKYVDDLSDNVKRGIRARIEAGWVTGTPPIGYLNDRNTKKIVKDPERFAVVRRMWDLMLTGRYTPERIEKIATHEWGLRTRKSKRLGGKPLSRSAVYSLFRHSFYCGIGKHCGESFMGAHEPLVTKAEFDRVQEMLGRRGNPRAKRHNFPYTGLIRCGECGASVTAEHKVNRHGYEYTYYHCTKRKQGVQCNQRSVEHDGLEEQILRFLESVSIPANIRDWAIRVLAESQGDELAKLRATRQSLERRLGSCKREISELVNVRVRGLLTDHEFAEKKSELERERLRIELQLENGPEMNMRTVQVLCEGALDFASNVVKRFEHGTSEEKKSIIQCVGSNLTLKDKILSIHAQKPFNYLQRSTQLESSDTARLEPQILGEEKQKTDHALVGYPAECGRLDDVRTFFAEHLGEDFPFLRVHKDMIKHQKRL